MTDRTNVGPNLRPTHRRERWIQDVIHTPRTNITPRLERKITPRYRDEGGDIIPVHTTKETDKTFISVQPPPKLSGFDTIAKTMPLIQITHPQPYTKPAIERTQFSSVLKRQIVKAPKKHRHYAYKLKKAKTQVALLVLALFIFTLGVATNIQTLKTNKEAKAQVASLSGKVQAGKSAGDVVVPSTVRPSNSAFQNYVVATDLARYLRIPKLNVTARVLQVGITTSGAINTPNNIYDTAWYTGSAKPGQPGATIIDGHISGWTTRGVFYALKNLSPGDSIQIVKGDGTLINYKVVRSQIYGSNNVDMQSAIKPVTPGKSGLNLISCTGSVLKGTSQYNQRIIVYAEQI
ncbi:MAG: class F sortase [Candidatus Saccharimonadales bacterium]